MATPTRSTIARVGLGISALLLLALSAQLFLIPGALVVRDLSDDALGSPGISQRARELHRSLSERIEPWARQRVASGVAAHLPLYDVPSTEWPIFTCVFYLNATESLAEQGVDVSYALPAVQAARDLVMDPAHHTWVRTHWGDDYLHDRNVFFRSLLIGGLTSYEAITHSGDDLAFLRDQVETQARDLDESPHGVLEDYPGETYPIDVLAAIYYIKRADRVLGTDHGAFIERARRAFVAPYDDELGLVRFRVDLPSDGSPPIPVQPGRGIGNSWVGIYAPELWPEEAERWYAVHEREFWQERSWATGFREYRRHGPQGEWTFEIDAGPVLDGFGTAASAFGIAAARRNGRFDHAAMLTSQMVATSWPLPDGSLLVPQQFSHPHAPYLGESALLYFLTVQPAQGVPIVTGWSMTPLVYFSLFVYFGLMLLTLLVSARAVQCLRCTIPSTRRLVVSAMLISLACAALLVEPFAAYALLLVGVLAVGRDKRPKRQRRTFRKWAFILSGAVLLGLALVSHCVTPVGMGDFAINEVRYRTLANANSPEGCVADTDSAQRFVLVTHDRGHFGRFGYAFVTPSIEAVDTNILADAGCLEWEHAWPVADGWWALESHLD